METVAGTIKHKITLHIDAYHLTIESTKKLEIGVGKKPPVEELRSATKNSTAQAAKKKNQ